MSVGSSCTASIPHVMEVGPAMPVVFRLPTFPQAVNAICSKSMLHQPLNCAIRYVRYQRSGRVFCWRYLFYLHVVGRQACILNLFGHVIFKQASPTIPFRPLHGASNR